MSTAAPQAATSSYGHTPARSNSAGLGISFINHPGTAGPSEDPLLIGMSPSPDPRASPTQPQQRSRQSSPSSSRPLPSPSHSARPAPSSRGQPLFQPTFSLRPTHTRHNSTFTTFSALPPSPGTRSAMMTPPKGPRPSTSASKAQSMASPTQDYRERLNESRKASNPIPKRSPSTTSTSTSLSNIAGILKKTRSSEMLRRLSVGKETISGGKYQPLSGGDAAHQPVNTPYTETSYEPTPLADALQFPTAFPLPPSTDEHENNYNPPTRSFVELQDFPRSQSTPLFPTSETYSRPPPITQTDNSQRGQINNRFSDPMSASHSQNAALFSAESGGMMLSYSPSQGVYKPGQMIYGGRSEWATSPIVAPIDQNDHGKVETELKARPWSESTDPHSNSNRPGRGRSLSEGYLARQGTLLNPNSSTHRAGQELGVLLGKSKRLSTGKLLPVEGEVSEKIRLEAAKKGKARVEVGVILERECLVEGGEVRGRLEVKVRGGKRGEGVRVGGGKVRVVGFEDVSPSSRHIFYHHPHPLPLFDNPPIPNGPTSTLLHSEPDSEGYHLAGEGVHSIPFSFRLPLGGGAKGSFTTTGGKGPSIRYVVVGSIKIFVPPQSLHHPQHDLGKRSIAHFYRSIVVLPYLNPSFVLAPAEKALEAHVESGLGWSLSGEKGKVEVGVSMGRNIWVSGQRVWCEVGIRNDSTRKIKMVNLALLQTVQVFSPRKDFEPRRPTLPNRASIMNCIPQTPHNLDQDTGEVQTMRRKLVEEVLEADSTGGSGRVTGKGWWTGVDPGERGHWDMSLQIPPGMISIPRSRLIDVSYLIRVTVNNSIYVDLPITLINFLSIDPPPMPGDARMRQPGSQPHKVPAVNSQSVYQPTLTRGLSDLSAGSGGNPARASSTTLHIDALLEQGRARAELEETGTYQRPLSMGSDYTPVLPSPALQVTSSNAPMRPKGARVMSYLSVMSDSAVSDADEIDQNEQDKALLEARRRQGRQMSLAAITRAMQRAENDAFAEEDEDDREVMDDGEFKPAQTPSEEQYKLGDTPSMVSGMSPMPPSSRAPDLEIIEHVEMESSQDDHRLVPDHTGRSGHTGQTAHTDIGSIPLPTETGGYDYGEEVEDDSERNESIGPIRGTPEGGEDLKLLPRARFDSFANSAISGVSEQESEIGQVFEAVKRNLSTRLPPRVIPDPTHLTIPYGVGGERRSSQTDSPIRESPPRGLASRRGSSPQVLALGMRRESSNTPSPLRTDLKPSSLSKRTLSPTKVRLPDSPSASIRSTLAQSEPAMSSSMRRGHSANSHLRHQLTADEEDIPGLAPSVASDSASSDGHALDSPPIVSEPAIPHLTSSRMTSETLETISALKSYEINPKAQDAHMQPTWRPEPIATQIFMVQRDQGPTSERSPYRVRPTSSINSSPSSTHSILPSVQTKIAQLESRDEALRKFSVSASVAPGPSSPSISTTATPHKRRSYTQALAPRSTSYDLDNVVGYTTYTVKRSYSNSRPNISPYGSMNSNDRGGYRVVSPRLQRNVSNGSSISMGATTIEHALMNMSPIGGGTVPTMPDEGYGSLRSYTSGFRSGGGSGGDGGGYSSPGGYRYSPDMGGSNLEVGVAEETDDSEGLV